MLSTKERTLGRKVVIPPIFEEFGGSTTIFGPGATPTLNSSVQVTESESHKKSRNGSYLEGGPFYTSKVELKELPQFHLSTLYSPGDRIFYDGPYFPGPYHLWIDDFNKHGLRSKDTSDLDSLGATAIARVSPVNPVDTLGSGLLENYNDGLPHIPGIHTWAERASVFKRLGDEFLNTVFGWKPLIDEVRSFGSTVRNSRDILKQYHENQGTNQRQTFEFPIHESEGSEIIAENTHAELGTGFTLNTAHVHVKGDSKVIRSFNERIVQRFVGSFTYAVPSQTDSWRRLLGYGSDADKLFGIALTPELLWDLTPWSWAVDWFSNAGDVLTNISNFAGAGLVMRYGYMMEERSTTITYTMDQSSFYIDGTQIPVPTIEFVSTSKVRRPANPYGFGVKLESLSPLQIAIAIALGITRL